MKNKGTWIYLVIVIMTIMMVGCDKVESKAPKRAPVEQVKKTEHFNDQTEKTTEKEMANPKLKVGDKAPEWKLESDDEGTFDSESLKGQKYVLYFYPKDMTPGCTIEANDFQEKSAEFAEKGYRVFGVSGDSIESHRQFREEHGLGFALLSDPDHEVAKAFGVWREKNVYGKNSVGMVRSTFVVDEEGVLTHVFDNVKAGGHVERLLRDLE